MVRTLDPDRTRAKAMLTMYRFRPKQVLRPEPGYATRSDFCESLVHDSQPLYLLAFLLTGSHPEAEQCFIATVEDAAMANDVFKGWESSWSKRCLIMNAVRCVFPKPTESMRQPRGGGGVEVESAACSTINSVAGLAPPVQRFVFVISVLEKYSEHECALLLGLSPRDVVEARIHALWQLSGVGSAFPRAAG
jgi:hypothetical protein